MIDRKDTKQLTEEECLNIGGHCYGVADYVLQSLPPINVRTCKHCGRTQHGIEQPSIRWE